MSNKNTLLARGGKFFKVPSALCANIVVVKAESKTRKLYVKCPLLSLRYSMAAVTSPGCPYVTPFKNSPMSVPISAGSFIFSERVEHSCAERKICGASNEDSN